MKGKIIDSLKLPLTKMASDVRYWKLMRCQEVVSVWEKTINSWISEVKQYEENMANEKSQNRRGERQIDEIIYAKGGLLLMVESRELWTLKLKLWTNQIWTLISNFVIVLACAKCSKLKKKHKRSCVQQLLLCFLLFFAFSSEVLNRVIKSCFDGVVFQDAVCKERFSIRLRCLHL